jgi:hypothetical protein
MSETNYKKGESYRCTIVKKKKHNFYSFPWNGTQKKDNKIHRMTSARETISGGVNEKENGD